MAALFKHAEHIFGDLENFSRNNCHNIDRIVYNIRTKILTGNERKAILLVFAEIVADSGIFKGAFVPGFYDVHSFSTRASGRSP